MNKSNRVRLVNEARDMTKKLAALAEKYQCAIVLEADWNNRFGHNEQCEQSSHQTAYRGMGSIDFFAVAKKRFVGWQGRGRRKYKGCGTDKKQPCSVWTPESICTVGERFSMAWRL